MSAVIRVARIYNSCDLSSINYNIYRFYHKVKIIMDNSTLE